ncbi:MAG TPA: hypothetical protein VGK10_18035 [Prolixibacteraceae bacterium]|jgi:hypothetical protein
MEESKEAVEGEQPASHQDELKKETTDPFMNKKPVVRKARSKASAVLVTKKPASTSSASKAVPASSSSKPMASGASPITNLPDEDLKKHAGHNGHKASKDVVKTDLHKSGVATKPKSGSDKPVHAKAEVTSIAQKGKEVSEKPLKTLEKSTKKAEKKVVKLKKKVKKAIKKDVKKSKLQILKDKLLKAFSKLRRSSKKLKKVHP